MIKSKTNRLTLIGIFTAISTVLYFLKFPLPFFPPFLTMDGSDIPALIVGIIYGPVAGIMIQFLKNVLGYLLQGSYVGLPMGQIANFLSGALMVGLASFLFKKWEKPPKLSFVFVISAFLFLMYLINLYFILPIIVGLLGLNMVDYVNWIKATNPYVNDLKSIVLFVVTPFNLIKIATVYLIGIPLALKLKRILINSNLDSKLKKGA